MQKPIWILSKSGKTIDDAVNGLQGELANRVFFGHLRIIVVNQALAQTVGMQDIQDFFRRNAEIRRLAWLIISKGSAKQAIEAAPQLERVPTLYLVGTMDHAVHMGKIPNIFLGNYWSIQSSKGRDPILPFISVHGKDRIKIEGLAVFKGNRMVSHLDQLGVAAYMELTNEHHAGYGVAVPMPGDPVHSVIIKGTSRKTRVKMSKENNKPVFDVYERIEANIEEITGNVRNSSERMNQIGNETTRLLIKNQEATLKKLQEMHTDIIGFGEYVRGQYPEYWFRLRQQKDWGDEFEHLNIRLHLKVYMRRIGMSTR